jgi:hypothetical protein
MDTFVDTFVPIPGARDVGKEGRKPPICCLIWGARDEDQLLARAAGIGAQRICGGIRSASRERMTEPGDGSGRSLTVSFWGLTVSRAARPWSRGPPVTQPPSCASPGLCDFTVISLMPSSPSMGTGAVHHNDQEACLGLWALKERPGPRFSTERPIGHGRDPASRHRPSRLTSLNTSGGTRPRSVALFNCG